MPCPHARYKKAVPTDIASDWVRDVTKLKSYDDSLRRRKNQFLHSSSKLKLEQDIPTTETIINIRHYYDNNLITINDSSDLININDLLTEEDKALISHRILEKANQLINKIYSIAKNRGFWWDEPLVNVTEDQEIVLEWWNNTKKITIYISDKTIDYIKVWGADMDNEMEDDSIDLHDDFTPLWSWINK
jgi:hypothetical protein